MPYQRQNPNQCDIYTNQMKSHLPNYRPNIQQNTNNVPILQRLFQAQQRQQLIHSFSYLRKSFSFLLIDMNNVKLILEINTHHHMLIIRYPNIIKKVYLHFVHQHHHNNQIQIIHLHGHFQRVKIKRYQSFIFVTSLSSCF
jgi:hypothetical protein